MKVLIKHVGYSPASKLHTYDILTANGVEDRIYEREYTKAKEVDMPDRLWEENSGWADIECEACHYIYQERCIPGDVVACPMCGEPFLVPSNAVLEWSNCDP
jgi:hypothetical protein